jgi:preprotein translocase subunit SecG
MNALIVIFTIVLILVSLFLILVVLAQKAKSDGGMGAAMGGGVAESAFGAETGNVLSKATINAAVAFFVLSFLTYLGYIYQRKHTGSAGSALPSIPASVGLPAGPTASAAPVKADAVTAAPVAPAPVESKKP